MTQRKNILLIYTDQQRWDSIAALGNPDIHTPHLDALVASGTSFENTFVNCPVCMPSRMSMLSGRYPSSLNIQHNGSEMPEEIPCVQHILQGVGYRTANIGKLHFKNHASAYRDHRDPYPAYGFDVNINSDEPGCYEDSYIDWVRHRAPDQLEACRIDTPPAWTGEAVTGRPREVHEPYVFEGSENLTHSAFVAERTCQFLKESEGREPFFCIAGFYAPHTPINPPQRFIDLYDPLKLRLPNRNEGENFENLSDWEWQNIKAHYYALVSHVDDQIGRIIETLNSTGLRSETVIIFTSDHGEYLGDHGRIQKGGPEDASSRVPLIFNIPHVEGGEQRVSATVEAVDIVPTMLDLCEVPRPSYLQGESLVPLILGASSQRQRGDSALIELKNDASDGYKAVRTPELLYQCFLDGAERLFDLKSDPGELADLSKSQSHVDLLNCGRRELMIKMIQSEPENRRRSGPY